MSKHRELLGGEVEGARVLPETADREIIRIMKVLKMVRMPDGLIAHIDLPTKKGLYNLEIDEATAEAIHKVFTDFRKEHPDRAKATAAAKTTRRLPQPPRPTSMRRTRTGRA